LRIAIVGSGFAGSILARILQIQGHRVLLLDRQKHPRFALGESSTPLAAICLERLAARYGLDDLHALAAWGRWMERLPHLRRGLKRGFTFYGHEPGRAFANGPANERRLLVAASPTDRIADTHWLREDVDHHLTREAGAAGVEVLEEVDLTGLEKLPGGWRLSGMHQARSVHFEADLLIDASGPGGFLARHLPIPTVETGLHTSLVFGHFEGMADFAEVVRNRRMTRAFDSAPVDPVVIDSMVDLASRAPRRKRHAAPPRSRHSRCCTGRPVADSMNARSKRHTSGCALASA
jgi:FADH2 O2-dependent halogenase